MYWALQSNACTCTCTVTSPATGETKKSAICLLIYIEQQGLFSYYFHITTEMIRLIGRTNLQTYTDP